MAFAERKPVDTEKKDELLKAIWEFDVIRFGAFTNASEMFFPYLADPRKMMSDPTILKLIGELLGEYITKHLPHVKYIVGASTAGIAPAAAAALSADMPFAYGRSEAKAYLSAVQIEGEIPQKGVCVLIDDFLVRGKGKKDIIEGARKEGYVMNDVLGFFDCDLKKVDWYDDADVTHHSIITTREFFDYGLEHDYISKELHELCHDGYEDPKIGEWDNESDEWKRLQELADKEGFKKKDEPTTGKLRQPNK